ncbi:hypothetical protein SUGI_0821060 [Cryptomeria japonica]|nr:hypothetical protein SUGI_0821060 [Cryptomeria japonica]
MTGIDRNGTGALLCELKARRIAPIGSALRFESKEITPIGSALRIESEEDRESGSALRIDGAFVRTLKLDAGSRSREYSCVYVEGFISSTWSVM